MMGLPFDMDTFFMLAAVVLAVLVVRQYLKRRGDREATSRDWNIVGKATTFWERLKDRVMRMSKYAVAFTALVMFFLIPGGDNKLQYLVGVIFGLLLFGYVLPRLMAYNTFYAVDLEGEEVAVFDICNLMLPLYRFVDRDGKDASLEYSLWDRRGRAWIVDWVDLENRVIRVNPITMSMEFTKNSRRLLDELTTKANVYRNQRDRYKAKLDYEKKAEAVELLEWLHGVASWTPGDDDEILQEKLDEVRRKHDDEG